MKRAPSEQNFDDIELTEEDLNDTLIVKQDMTTKEKLTYMFYEAMGTFVLCYAYNLEKKDSVSEAGFPMILAIVSLISWEVSCAHFNWGLTVAYLFVDIDKFKEIWFKFACAAVAQLFGAVGAMCASRFATNVTTYPETSSQEPNINPVSNFVRPEISNNTEVKQQIFGAEFISSFVFYTAWIIIRKTNLKTNENLTDETINLIKPLFVMLAYVSSSQLFSQLSVAIMNPTIVFGTWIFNLLIYNNLKVGDPKITMFRDENLGRFVWIYFFAALISAPLSGFIAKQLLKALKQNDLNEKKAPEEDDNRKSLMSNKSKK